VAERVRSLYRCGERSADWVKVKNYQTETFTIGGWVTDEAGLLHSLLVGQREGRGLRYAGEIEYGFRPGERARLETLLESLTRSESSFIGLRSKRRAIYVEPRVDAEVRFLTFDSSGLLRHATYRGLSE
jgi:bifunctional non-homologous end joining protein LigD